VASRDAELDRVHGRPTAQRIVNDAGEMLALIETLAEDDPALSRELDDAEARGLYEHPEVQVQLATLFEQTKNNPRFGEAWLKKALRDRAILEEARRGR
jgi:hypothetical protein